MRPDLRTLLVAGSLAAGAGACQSGTAAPAGQLVLYVTTDAPLPPPAGESTSPGQPAALFDRALVEFFPPGADSPCASCSREFALDVATVDAGASVGLQTPVGQGGWRARVRVYASRGLTGAGLPPDAATLEAVVALPAVGAEGITELSVVLSTDSLGQPSGTLDAPADAMSGPPPPHLAGTWPGAQRTPCAGQPGAGEVCVPGGAYWMGNPGSPVAPHGIGHDQARIVVLSPFFLDADEATVADVRASGVATAGDPMPAQPGYPCVYTPAPGASEPTPVDCITWSKARDYCKARGKDLPTEAQLEYVLGALRSADYVWGESPPACGGARFGLGLADMECLDTSSPLTQGGAIARQGALDRLVLPTGTLFDLAGDMREWALDYFAPQGSACWGPGVLPDPTCGARDPSQPETAQLHTVRGGFWGSPPTDLEAAERIYYPGYVQNTNYGDGIIVADVGVRCARPGR